MPSSPFDFDAVIVGGGFFGCCLALYLRSFMPRILVIEAEPHLLQRASRVNQARVHTGFHYPRSFTTALRSRALSERFMRDFPHAIVNDFEMLYAIASRRSKVTASRFARMFQAVDAPFYRAPRELRALFDRDLIEEVFVCKEFAFDWSKLRLGLVARLQANGIQVRLGEAVVDAVCERERVVITSSAGREFAANVMFNVTYANLNTIYARCGLPPLALKHELAEIALVESPAELRGRAVTVMDGPFFSAMPYPAERLYSLTHVRYTPHYSWTDSAAGAAPDDVVRTLPKHSRWRHMIQDARRYLPCLESAVHRQSMFEVKTVLVRNERDDGRPIMLHRHAEAPRIISVMGGKIDNIYDLFDALPDIEPRWRSASLDLLFA